MQRFRQETGKSHRAGPVLTSAENDLAALQENFSFSTARFIYLACQGSRGDVSPSSLSSVIGRLRTRFPVAW